VIREHSCFLGGKIVISREYEFVLRCSCGVAFIAMAALTLLWQQGLIAPLVIFAPLLILLLVFLSCFVRDWRRSVNSPLGRLMNKRW
jgi:hypothetical protein